MKRKELQALCKQHGVPANLTNLEMVDRLSSLYKVWSLLQSCFLRFFFVFLGCLVVENVQEETIN